MTSINHDGLTIKLFAGGLSCMVISAVLNPLDVVKVALQTQSQLKSFEHVSSHHLNDYLFHPSRSFYENSRYHGTWDALKTIFREEGYRRGLMKGITASMLREATYSSLRMGLYDSIKILLAPKGTNKDQFTLTHKLIAGAGSGTIGSFISTPTDLVKIRFQSYSSKEKNPYRNTFEAFYRISKDEKGLRGLYKGATPNVFRAALLTSVQLSSYDQIKRIFIQANYFQDNLSTHLLASFSSGLITTTIVNPADMIKTRIMSEKCSNQHLYRSPLDCLKKTIIKEGLPALMKGWLPNYLRIGPHSLVSLPLAEFIRTSLGTDSF